MSMGALLVPALALLGDIESQYNQLFEDHNATALDVVTNCVALPDDVAATLPEGSFIMPSLGQFRMQNMALNGALDAFGKLSRFTIARGRVFCIRMMQTAFWNESVATNRWLQAFSSRQHQRLQWHTMSAPPTTTRTSILLHLVTVRTRVSLASLTQRLPSPSTLKAWTASVASSGTQP